MAQYLVIEFDNDAQADALYAQITAAQKKGKAFRVVGRFKRHTIWCGCSRTLGADKDRFKRSLKYGVWVCRYCKRPRSGMHWLENLIPQSELTSSTRGSWRLRVTQLGVFEIPHIDTGTSE